MRRVFIAAGLVAWAALAAAQDGALPAPDPKAAVRAAYAECRAALKTSNDEKDAAKQAELEKQYWAAAERFQAQFDKIEWSAWVVAADKDLLWYGVHHASNRANDAGDVALARKGYEFILTECKGTVYTNEFVLMRLPSVYAALGAIDEGVAFLAGCRSGLAFGDAASASLGMCDLLAVQGDFNGATKARSDAASALEIAASRKEDVSPLVKQRLEIRARVGQKIADLGGADSATGRAFRLSSAAGKPGLCLVFSLFGDPEPKSFKTLSAAQEKCARSGLVVVGITSFDLVSPLTKVESEVETMMPRGPDDKTGDPVKVSRDGFRKHVEAVRLRVRASFPFVVAPENSLREYAGYARNHAILLDEQGRVVMDVDRYEMKSVPRMAEALCARLAAAKTAGPK